MTQKAKDLLQKTITEFKIEKATAQLQFIEERYNEKKKEFELVQEKLAAFRDRNKNVTSAIALTHEEQLQNEYQLAFNVYSELAQQLEQAQIRKGRYSGFFYHQTGGCTNRKIKAQSPVYPCDMDNSLLGG